MPDAEPSPEPGSADPATEQTTSSGAGSAEPTTTTSTEAEKPRAPARRRWRSLSGVARLAVIHDRHPDHPDHLDLSEALQLWPLKTAAKSANALGNCKDGFPWSGL